MSSFNSTIIFQQSRREFLINGQVTGQAAAEVTGYNNQYLRRVLRSGALEEVKTGQMWLIDLESREAY